MEFVNSRSVRVKHSIPRNELDDYLARYSHVDDETVLATDGLELIRGPEISSRGASGGDPWLPLVRVTKAANREDFPTRVVLELTNHCNSDCTMCPRNAMTRPLVHMDTALARRLIEEVAREGVNALWLFNIGESLLHPDFFDILGSCRTREIAGTIWLSTNGQKLDGSTRRALLANPVDILNISVNAMTEEAYAKVSPALDFRTIRKNIFAFIEEREAGGHRLPLVRVQMVEVPHVMDQIAAFKELFADKADILSINRLEEFSGEAEASRGAAARKNGPILRCNRLERNDFFVMADGRVTCCATDFNARHELGNAVNGTIKEIFTGEKYAALMGRYRRGTLHELGVCSTCRDFNL